MAFLDNSGDIILDAVLTTTGRKRLAEGNGSFRVTKYALFDDGINYKTANLIHSGGIAYYFLETLQTPVLEAFSNDAISGQSKLISYTNPNLLYMPILLHNTNANKSYSQDTGLFPYDPAASAHIVTTGPGENMAFNSGRTRGVLDGINPGSNRHHIRLEFGIDAPGRTPASLAAREPELNETQFMIECDTRFCRIADLGGRPLTATFDDQSSMATYIVSSTNSRMNGGIVSQMNQFGSSDDLDQPEIKWLRGALIQFKVLASSRLQRDGRPSATESLWSKFGNIYNATAWNTAASSIGVRETCGTSGQANNLQTRAEGGGFYNIATFGLRA
jgi:hypothetical protein